MTGRAAILWLRRAAHVLRVVELHVEAFFEFVGKAFPRRIAAISVGMADETQRRILCQDLILVAIKTIFVTGKTGQAGIIRAMMTVRATNRSMTLTGMEKPGIVEILTLREDEGKRKKAKRKKNAHG